MVNDRRKDPNRPDATDVFHAMPVRLIGERESREADAARLMNYCTPFFDDVLRGILPEDLILLTAPSGIGKTDLSLNIAIANAQKEHRIGYFALEARERELEQRVKYSWISNEAWRRNFDRKHELNFTDWLVHRCEDIVGELDEAADRWIEANLSTLFTFYRGVHFTQTNLTEQIAKHAKRFSLIVVDHLHYIDFEGDERSETQAVGDTMKALRDAQLAAGVPVILVAHLRKRDPRLKQLVPDLEDIHGTKHITNICTQAITIAPATTIEAPKWWLAPTFMAVLKDRRAGRPPFVAMTMFDKRTRRYEDSYALGRLIKGGTDWEQIKPAETPGWATCHRQMEMQLG